MHGELQILSGGQIGRRYVLRLGQSFVLGRSSRVAVDLGDDVLISRRHALVELRLDGLYVTDLGSRNGTFLENRRLDPYQPVRAASGDTLEVGKHTIRLRTASFVEEEESRVDEETRIIKSPLLPPQEFELLGAIGQGATGWVYAAFQKLMRRKVAIKALHSDLDLDAESRERFLRQGWICARIQSPHVVEVYDARIIRGRVYLIMEFIQGPSAADRLRDGPLPVPEALKIGEHVALALSAASTQGVVHRDIKPSNVLLAPQGLAKLTDFGLARTLKTEWVDRAEGVGRGTLSYVAPEQACEAENADFRSDIYALGATLYHLLAGRPPFEVQSARELAAVLGRPAPPLQDHLSDCPSALAEIVHAMLEKEADDRPQSPQVVATTLRQLREERYPEVVSPLATTRGGPE